MKATIVFKRDNKNVKKPLRNHLNFFWFFLLYAPRNIKVGPAQYDRQDIDVVISLPENSQGYFISKFRTDKINKFLASNKGFR